MTQYWNDITLVQKYINKNISGNENRPWNLDILVKFSNFLPFEKVLIIGCGDKWEYELHEFLVGKEFDVIDTNRNIIELAVKKKGNRPFNYFVESMNTLENLKEDYYDAIFNIGFLNLYENLDSILDVLRTKIKPTGLMFNFEKIGPNVENFDDYFTILQNVNSLLPKKFQNIIDKNNPSISFSRDFRKIFTKYFDIVFQANCNGGIGFPILYDNIVQFKNKDKNSEIYLKKILMKDEELSSKNIIPILFWYGVGRLKIEH